MQTIEMYSAVTGTTMAQHITLTADDTGLIFEVAGVRMGLIGVCGSGHWHLSVLALSEGAYTVHADDARWLRAYMALSSDKQALVRELMQHGETLYAGLSSAAAQDNDIYAASWDVLSDAAKHELRYYAAQWDADAAHCGNEAASEDIPW